jgi:hypothetical protein
MASLSFSSDSSRPSHALSLHLSSTLFGVAALSVLASTALGQFRDSFESTQPTWSLKQADCGVRELAHGRTFRDARSGQACEHFQLNVGNGTFVYLVQPIGRAALIQEFRPTLFVKADRASIQLLARIVLPRSIDRGTGQPITSFLRGDLYTQVGHWQQLTIRDIGRLLDQEVRSLRAQFGAEIDAREVYVDFIALNAYSAPGAIELWIDDLEIEGFVDLDPAGGAQAGRRPSGTGPDAGSSDAPSPTVQGSLLLARGRPTMVRALQHHGEPLQWLQVLGFNTIKLSSSPSPTELNEARRLGMYLIAPPPYDRQTPASDTFGPIIAWNLGSRLTERDFTATQDLIRDIHTVDSQHDRPLLASIDSGLAEYSRLTNLLFLERPTLGTTQELGDLRRWLLTRSRLARPGTPILAAIDTQRPARLAEQLILFGRGAAFQEDSDPQQLRLQVFSAISAGARGLIFQSEAANSALAIDNGPAALRTDAIRLVNMEMQLLEPWIAAGQLSDELAAADGSAQVSVLTTDRSRLLLVTQHASAQQYVLGPPPRSSLSVLVPGIGASDRAYLISLAAVKPLKITHGSGGGRIVLDDASHAAAIVITQDPLAMHHLQKTVIELRAEACRLRCDLTARRLIQTVDIDRQLTELGHPLAAAAAWIREANDALQQAQRSFETSDWENCYIAATKAENLLARIRRGHWEQTAAAFPSPAASPCLAQFTTLPLRWTVAQRIQNGWGPNVQAAGDMETLDQMLSAGWQQQRQTLESIGTDVSLSLADPHSGRSALRMQAWPTDVKRAPQVFEKPLVWITSSPIPVRQGQMVQISGWVNVPRAVAAGRGAAGVTANTSEGLLVFDSIGGPDLGDRIRLTQGWRPFTLYRAAPQTGDLTVTFALSGLGDASIDDLSVALLNPDPIRPRN